MFRIITLLTVLFLYGCAGLGQVERVDDLTVSQLRKANEVKFYESDKELNYTSLGKIKGLSCKGSPHSVAASQEAAMTQLRIKAVKMGADAVLYPTCSHDVSVDWSNNCWESWICIGEAVSVKK